jgi:hypothetical protein
VSSLHVPVRPTWLCAGCGWEYPCHTRRAQLAAEYEEAPVSLAVFMGVQFADAAEDLANARPGDLYARFLGWVREPR